MIPCKLNNGARYTVLPPGNAQNSSLLSLYGHQKRTDRTVSVTVEGAYSRRLRLERKCAKQRKAKNAPEHS